MKRFVECRSPSPGFTSTIFGEITGHMMTSLTNTISLDDAVRSITFYCLDQPPFAALADHRPCSSDEAIAGAGYLLHQVGLGSGGCPDWADRNLLSFSRSQLDFMGPLAVYCFGSWHVAVGNFGV
jgi:hypothetical protein